MPFLEFLISVGLGGLIGLEREQVQKKGKFVHIAGVRTFALVSLFGTCLKYIENYSEVLSWILAAGFLLMLSGNYIASTIRQGVNGATTEVALFLTLIIGYLCGHQAYLPAIILSVIMLIILVLKKSLHLFAEKITNREMRSIIIFAALSGVILPLIPKTDLLYGYVNLFQAWLMIVLIAGISLLSYMLIKLLGASKGLFLSGFLGGLISSTAVTLSFAALSKSSPRHKWSFVTGIVFASSAMFARVFLEVLLVNNTLGWKVFQSLIVSSIVGILIAVWMGSTHKIKSIFKSDTIKEPAPLELKKAFGFGFAFIVISAAMKFLNSQFGANGIYAASFVSGMVDTDAISLSLANLANTGLSLDVAAMGILIAAYANTLIKLGYVWFLGDRKLAHSLLGIFIAMIGSGYVWYVMA
jgi:uncharacterized membrane protein (DUF4010 family)